MPISYLMKLVKKIKKVARESDMRIVSWEEKRMYEISDKDGAFLYWYDYPSARKYIDGGYPNIRTIITIEGRGHCELQCRFDRLR
jgi:hypothetical protein